MRINAKEMILTALFTALMVAGAYVKIPIPPVPISLQTFFCALAGILLGARLGALSQFVYMLIGLTGIPVFTQGGGPGYVLKPSFGYILGFILGAYVTGKVSELLKSTGFFSSLAAVLSGLAAIYAVGVPYIYLIMKLYIKNTDFTFLSAVSAGLAPFIIKDLIMFTLAAMLAGQIIPILKKAGLYQYQ